MRYRVKGVYKWSEIVDYTSQFDVIVDADNADTAMDEFIDGFDDWGDGEFYNESHRDLIAELMEDEDPEAMERDDQYRIMQALGVPTLFELEL